jgi:hypothetical protein
MYGLGFEIVIWNCKKKVKWKWKRLDWNEERYWWRKRLRRSRRHFRARFGTVIRVRVRVRVRVMVRKYA